MSIWSSISILVNRSLSIFGNNFFLIRTVFPSHLYKKVSLFSHLISLAAINANLDFSSFFYLNMVPGLLYCCLLPPFCFFSFLLAKPIRFFCLKKDIYRIYCVLLDNV